MNIQKKVRYVFHALLLSLFLLGVNVFAADKWLQPPALSGMDTWIGDTYNTSAQFDARDRIGGWGDNYYTFLRFDLSGLPLVATQAIIWRYTINEGGTTSPVEWYRIGSQWQANTLSIYNFPNLYSYLGSVPAPSVNVWAGANITTLYNQWRAGTSPQNFGVMLAATNTWNNWSSIASSRDTTGHRPQLQVTYTPQVDDNVIKLKWPLATAKANSVVTQAFNVPWSTGATCDGLRKLHNGTDYSAVAGTAVYAPEDGVVKEVIDGTGSGFGWAIVLEHNHPSGGKFTTVSWHVNPLVTAGSFVPRGMQIATVAHIDPQYGDHYHLGVRVAPYHPDFSLAGGLPQTSCVINNKTYPAFPEYFVNPEDSTKVLFQ